VLQYLAGIASWDTADMITQSAYVMSKWHERISIS